MAIDRTVDTLAYRLAGGVKTTGSLAPLPGKCGAQLSYTGTGPENPPRYCMQTPKKGRTTCTRFHGGGIPAGIASPAYKTGAYSRSLPTRLIERYDAAMDDPQLLSLRAEIGRLTVYYEDLERRCEDGTVVSKATLDACRKVLGTLATVNAARRTKDQGRLQMAIGAHEQACQALGETLQPAQVELAVRGELRECWDLRGKLCEREHKRQESLYNMITTERAFTLRTSETTAFLEALDKHVTDPTVKRAIRRYVAERFEQLARGPHRPALDAAGGAGPAADGAPEADD